MADVSVTVVGAGVVGLAVAARLAPAHRDLLILERNERHGSEASSRNSEVIHAGMYYTPGSLKARLCVLGNRLLYEFCARHDVPHRRTGKLITATSADEMPQLETLLRRGDANGVELRMLSAGEVRSLEPQVVSVAALESPTTGIVSAHALMDALLRVARASGAMLHGRSELVALQRRSADYLLTIRTGADRESFSSQAVVNAAGLDSDTVAGLAGIDLEGAGYRLHYCKGSYFSVSGAKSVLVSRLIYPVPDAVSLGVHAVVGLEGRLRFGPDAEYLEDRKPDYAVDEGKRGAFARAVRRLVPAIEEQDLSPDISGIRAKLQGPGDAFRDFVVAEESARGLPGLVNLIGIDSPGLTSALAIADHVAGLLGE